MLTRVSELLDLRLGAQDGEVGRLQDFYFDDQSWTIRYLIADTGDWLPGRQVLLSPFSLKAIHETDKIIEFDLTRRQIEESPSIDVDKPVTRQHEADYAQYYGWPMYWYGPVLWGPTPYPVFERKPEDTMTTNLPPEQTGDPHLRSVKEVMGYYVHAKDRDIGHVEDFIADIQDWAVRYMVIDTRNWWAGKWVLLPPSWIHSISWEDGKAHVDLDRETIRRAPEYDPDVPITRDYETRLFDYYGREGYWAQRAPV